MYQFDARIHVPEGSWITWPWAYDMLMAFLARALMALTGARDPLSVLAFVAPAWVFVNAGLFLGIASRLRLSLPMQALAMLFFTVLPLTQKLHRVGMLDHHYIEFTFVLGVGLLRAGLVRESRQPAPRGRAGGRARRRARLPQRAFHPAVAGAGDLRVALGLGRPIDRRGALAFAVALVAGRRVPGAFRAVPARRVLLLPALLVPPVRGVLHSPAVRAGERGPLYAEAAAGLVLLLAAMAAPVVPQLVHGRDFLFARLPYLDRIEELGSIPRELARGDWWPVTLSYSPALWLLPLGLGGLLWRLRRDSSNAAFFPGAGAGRLVPPAAVVPHALLRHFRADPAALPPDRRCASCARPLRLAAAQAGARRARRRAAAGLPAAPQVRVSARRQQHVHPDAAPLRGARRRLPQGAGRGPRRAQRRPSHPLSLRSAR